MNIEIEKKRKREKMTPRPRSLFRPTNPSLPAQWFDGADECGPLTSLTAHAHTHTTVYEVRALEVSPSLHQRNRCARARVARRFFSVAAQA